MTTNISEMEVPSTAELYWKQEGATTLIADGCGSSSGDNAFKNRGATATSMDRELSRLLHNLVVRRPVQTDIQSLCIWRFAPGSQSVRRHVLMPDLPIELRTALNEPMADAMAAWVSQHQQLLKINTGAETLFPEFAWALLEAGMKSFCGVPLMIANQRIGVLGLVSAEPDAFNQFNLDCILWRSPEASKMEDHMIDLKGVNDPDQACGEATSYLKEKVRMEDKFEGIIGRSASLRAVLDQVKIVAPTNSTVLILGETGTGKELIARAIHNRSSRSERSFVRINCAAIPSGLLESELFGHERGAFTGAIARKIGRFELAHGGTLFLDEIGDIPPELQPKLLRVLQEQEFERLGSSQTIRVNVRVVAATSRDLPQMVANREFRSDLYYRLNVFPVRLPALRERPEDISLLVRHFVDFYAKRMDKTIERISNEAIDIFTSYAWPGNVRELQNFIERAVILSPGKFLCAPLTELKLATDKPNDSGQRAAPTTRTLKDAEREHILQALAETNWVVGGVKGAAARIGLQRTTLISKMQKLGISRAQA